MARKKKTKTKTKQIFFGFGHSKKRTVRKISAWPRLVKLFVVIFISGAIVCVFCWGTYLGFRSLKQYVQSQTGAERKTGELELVDVPGWVSGELVTRIHLAAAAGGEDFRLDEDAARSVAENISSLPWLEDVRVRTTNRAIRVKARFRKPVCFIRVGTTKFYIDSNLVILDYLALPKLPVVELKTLSAGSVPAIGRVWNRDDLTAAIEVLKLLERMDEQIAPTKSLLYEIATIDVRNYAGRRSSGAPHILLYAKDGTEIRWGAEVGDSSRYMEAPEDEKLAMLYGFYKERGTIQNCVKYIELRHPRKKIPQPTDRF